MGEKCGNIHAHRHNVGSSLQMLWLDYNVWKQKQKRQTRLNHVNGYYRNGCQYMLIYIITGN